MGEGRKAACSHPALPRRVASPNYVSLPGKSGWVNRLGGKSDVAQAVTSEAMRHWADEREWTQDTDSTAAAGGGDAQVCAYRGFRRPGG